MASRTLTWHSRDGHWKVEGISINGQPLFRIWHDEVSYRRGLLLHEDLEPDYNRKRGNSRTRLGPVYGADGWILASDVPWPFSKITRRDLNKFVRKFRGRLKEPQMEEAA